MAEGRVLIGAATRIVPRLVTKQADWLDEPERLSRSPDSTISRLVLRPGAALVGM